MHAPSIREIDLERDASDLVELFREATPTAVMNVASLIHRLLTVPERLKAKAWVAEVDGRVVGRVDCFLSLFETESRIALVPVAVREEHRGRGIGSALYEIGLTPNRPDGLGHLEGHRLRGSHLVYHLHDDPCQRRGDVQHHRQQGRYLHRLGHLRR